MEACQRLKTLIIKYWYMWRTTACLINTVYRKTAIVQWKKETDVYFRMLLTCWWLCKCCFNINIFHFTVSSWTSILFHRIPSLLCMFIGMTGTEGLLLPEKVMIIYIFLKKNYPSYPKKLTFTKCAREKTLPWKLQLLLT